MRRGRARDRHGAAAAQQRACEDRRTIVEQAKGDEACEVYDAGLIREALALSRPDAVASANGVSREERVGSIAREL